MNWYLAVLKQYATFSGRARRKEYWFFMLFNLLFTVGLTVLDMVFGTYNAEMGWGALSLVYTLAVLLPSLAVTVRRLHDSGKAGWWILLVFIPVIGGIIMLVLMCLDSKPDNEYGPNPKHAL